MTSDLRAEFSRWGHRINLGLVLRHYEAMEGRITEDEDTSDPRGQGASKVARRLNAANAILLTCATVEEILWLTWRRVLPDRKPGHRGGLDRFKAALGGEGLGFSLGEAAWWETLKDAFVVRDCLLHGNGRVSLLKENTKDRFRAVLEREEPAMVVYQDRIEIRASYVEKVVRAAAGMVDAIAGEG